jgi:tetratricopeptide (TPR) repeat protein
MTDAAHCSLLIEDGGGSRHETVGPAGATIGTQSAIKIAAASALAEHARIALVGGAWTVAAAGSAAITVNGARIHRTWVLEGADRIRIAEASVTFFPVSAPPLAGPAHGFSRARHYIQAALQHRNDDRKFVQRLASLEEAVLDQERWTAVLPAIALIKDKKFQKAAAALDRVLAISPRHANALLHKGICMMQLSRVDEASALFASARDAASDDATVRTDADEWVARLRELGPRIELNRAIDLMNDKQFAGAGRILTAALSRYPGDAALLYHLAVCEAGMSNFITARAVLDRITGQVDPELRGSIADLRRQLARSYP